MTPEPIQLVIFDCDGVLIDSEALSNRVVATEITKLGWPMDGDDAMARFIGYRLSDIPPVVEAHLGRPVPDGWVDNLRASLIAAFDTVALIPGAREALQAVTAAGLPYRVASNSSHEEMEAKFANTGLAALIAGRQHSARDVPRGKPHPDVFLAAAAAECIPPAACLVIEDSVPGATAAVAAGMTVLGLDPQGDGAALAAVGAHPIRSLAELPAILRAARRQAA